MGDGYLRRLLVVGATAVLRMARQRGGTAWVMGLLAAARLMGADCIISGIRPQIAQTIVHLGLELGVVSKATMADAFALALRQIGKGVYDRKPGGV